MVGNGGNLPELHSNPSACTYMENFNIEWPCLSFDIIRDYLGLVRTQFPHTAYGVTGTQAKMAEWNFIAIFKLSNIIPKAHDDDTDMDFESSSEDEDEDEAHNDNHTQPIFQVHKVAHHGGVYRIRSMTQKPHICASWAETGHVQVWDFSSSLNALADSTSNVRPGDNKIHNQSPVFKFDGHENEGFAMDWNPVTAGKLVTGGQDMRIHLWEPSSESWNVDRSPFIWHTASVEDLQWSPIEADVFASCSADGRIAIWDTRIGNSPTVSIEAHKSDVNVISWNRLASYLIASGSDDCTFSIWDMRAVKKAIMSRDLRETRVADSHHHFKLHRDDSLFVHSKYHKDPIISIEWSPFAEYTLAVSSEDKHPATGDSQLTIWDVSVGNDEDKANMKEQPLFVHQGEKNLRELHWHQQIPGLLISTTLNGFNVLIPSNIEKSSF